MDLPKAFEERMLRLLGAAELGKYKDSLIKPVYKALRVNTLKISAEDFKKLSPWDLERVPWTKNGFYYEEEGKTPVSKHPFYHAGLYYMQEPSAMAPAQLLPVEKGDKVLDICAAPGGKSTELGARLEGSGVLVCNDISASRTKALLKNIELFGIRNAAILNETPERLSHHFPQFFDKILVDAPCSGEGMFRKESAMMKNWEEKGEDFYVNLQNEIIPHAVSMLKPGGYLLYSTCTFSPREDEMQVKKLLDLGLEIVDLQENPLIKEEIENGSIENGHPEWIGSDDLRLRGCLRFFPHRVRGEGHFIALLKKGIEEESSFGAAFGSLDIKSGAADKNFKLPPCSLEFFEKVKGLDGFSTVMGKENLYLIPKELPELTGLHVVRSGILAGTVKNYSKSTFEPAQALAMAIGAENFEDVISLSHADERCVRYLKGETIEVESDRTGWQLVTVDGFPLGFGRAQGGKLKNKYSKGWRMV